MDLDDLAPNTRAEWDHATKRGKARATLKAAKGSRGALAAAANGTMQGAKVNAERARLRRVPITLPSLSIQKRDEA